MGRGPELRQQQGTLLKPATYLGAQPLGTVGATEFGSTTGMFLLARVWPAHSSYPCPEEEGGKEGTRVSMTQKVAHIRGTQGGKTEEMVFLLLLLTAGCGGGGNGTVTPWPRSTWQAKDMSSSLLDLLSFRSERKPGWVWTLCPR